MSTDSNSDERPPSTTKDAEKEAEELSDKGSEKESGSGDEAIIALKVDGEVTDTSIVEVGRMRPQYQYSREELMRIKILPLSKKRPECLNAAILNNSRGNWNPDCWRVERKRSETPEEDLRLSTSRSTDSESHQKRRSGDPRERIRKEQDGIVLSPQRRSFNSGCFVSVSQANNKRPDSPPGKPEIIHREPPVRRIGSGRILTRDMWDFRPESDKHEPEFSFRGPAGPPPLRDRDREPPTHRREDRLSHRGDHRNEDHDPVLHRGDRDRDRPLHRDRESHRGPPDRYGSETRRSYGSSGGYQDRNERNLEGLRSRGHQSGGYDNHRRSGQPMSNSSRYEQKEPEWFSGGPTSQADTIELKGFDDGPEEKPQGKKEGAKEAKERSARNANRKTRKNLDTSKGDSSNASSKSDDKSIEKSLEENLGSSNKENLSLQDNKDNRESKGPRGRSTPNKTGPIEKPNEPHSPITEKEGVKLMDQGKKNKDEEAKDESASEGKEKSKEPNFNLDDFLKADTLPEVQGFIGNGVGGTESSSSRFSQWFKRESPTQNQILDSRGASLQDELLNNLLNEGFAEPKVPPAGAQSNAFFTPIAPVSNNVNNNNKMPQVSGGATQLLEMLHKKPQNCQADTARNVNPMGVQQNLPKEKAAVPGKLVSLVELEAQMRGGVPAPAPPAEVNKSERQTESDLAAFKKLLAQVSGGQVVPASNGPIPHKNMPPQGQSMSLMQMLHSQMKNPQQQGPPSNFHPNQESMQQQQQQMPPPFNHVGPLGPVQSPHQSQVQHENLMKVLQIQQQQQQQQQQHKQRQQQQQQQQQQNQMLSMMMNQQHQRMTGMSPVPTDLQMMINNTPSARELLQRPEAEAIIRGLQQGEITKQHLIQQLQNPAMQSRHRELLVSILKHYNVPNQRNNSPHTSQQDHMLQQLHNLYQQQQQQQQHQAHQHKRIPSPINNVMPTHRVPSPRELAAHNQSIFQNALLKKKLEEQRENYRKRQGQQQQQQRPPSPVNSPVKQMLSSPTPLAFTPTSVLRKMTADKEPEGGPEPPSSVKLSNQSQGVHLQLQSNVQMISQGVVSRHSNFQTPPIQANWPNPTVKQQPGRPIVKGSGANNQMQFGGGPDPIRQQQQTAQPQQQHSSMFGGNIGQRCKFDQSTARPTPQFPMGQQNVQMPNQMKIPPQFAGNQQQPPVKSQITQQVVNQSFTSSRTVIQQQMSMNVGRQNSPGVSNFLGGSGGDLSPTSNQLARWFSPELLAQARTIKLPELGSSNVLSLEELERLQHSSTSVHN